MSGVGAGGARAGWAERWSRWVAFWSETESGLSWAAFRVLVGLVTAWVAFSCLYWDAVPIFVADSDGGLARDGSGVWWWAAWVGSTESHVRALLVACLVGALSTAAGLGGRWVPLLTGQLFMAYFGLHPGTGGGHDRLITNAYWMMFWVSPTQVASVDAWLKTGRFAGSGPVLALGRRIGVWQLVYMYTLTGLEKQGDAWFAKGDYSALYRTFLLPSWQRYDLTGVVPHIYPLLQLSTVIAWWWEALWCVLALNLWMRRPSWAGTWGAATLGRYDLRGVFVALGIVTHGVLWVLMDLGPFTWMTFAFYTCLWTDEDTARLRAWWRGRSG
jgi:hypothetical protein